MLFKLKTGTNNITFSMSMLLVWHGVLIPACKTKTRPSREKDTPNPKQWGKQRQTTQAKIFPKHDMNKGKTCSYHGRLLSTDGMNKRQNSTKLAQLQNNLSAFLWPSSLCSSVALTAPAVRPSPHLPAAAIQEYEAVPSFAAYLHPVTAARLPDGVVVLAGVEMSAQLV